MNWTIKERRLQELERDMEIREKEEKWNLAVKELKLEVLQ